jgi:hypothetical protein
MRCAGAAVEQRVVEGPGVFDRPEIREDGRVPAEEVGGALRRRLP